MKNPTIEAASVKVMRSHDYCHFEVSLSSTAANSPEAVDELRKTAAWLADKAVDQYKVAKANLQRRELSAQQMSYTKQEADRIREKPETERTPDEQAALKTWNDRVFAANRAYDYQDDWQDDEDL